MTEVQILTAIKNNGGSFEYTDLLNLNITEANRDTLADKERIVQMLRNGLLKGETQPYSLISITDKGRLHLQNAAYLEEQNKQLAEDAAKDKSKKNRHDWSLAIGSAFIAGLIGLAFELIAFWLLR